MKIWIRILLVISFTIIYIGGCILLNKPIKKLLDKNKLKNYRYIFKVECDSGLYFIGYLGVCSIIYSSLCILFIDELLIEKIILSLVILFLSIPFIFLLLAYSNKKTFFFDSELIVSDIFARKKKYTYNELCYDIKGIGIIYFYYKKRKVSKYNDFKNIKKILEIMMPKFQSELQ